jgi:plasmid stabilization system protein ParE
MEKTYRLTSAAESDLIEILDYTTQQWGIAQADKYAGEIEDCLSAIVKGRVHAKAFLIEDIKILRRRTWLNFAHDCGYLEEGRFSEFLHASEEVGRLLGGILAKPETFCLKSDI